MSEVIEFFINMFDTLLCFLQSIYVKEAFLLLRNKLSI